MPAQAALFLVRISVPAEIKDRVMMSSGVSGVYAEPRTEDGLRPDVQLATQSQ